VCFHTSRKEAQSSKRVGGFERNRRSSHADVFHRAKYIEGLENRLGRMESLLRMSGLLSEEEAGKTDLGTLEKRLAEKASSKEASAPRTESAAPSKSSSASVAPENSPRPTSARDSLETPRDTVTSPSTDGDKPSREEVENLSEAMCSLVTNNVGETRYIGKFAIGSCGASPNDS
jgi:CCR4-NOT transcriptional regulation complex NOT5 subunit